MPILALDYGDRHIGIAITDLDDKIALRHSAIDQKDKQAITEINNIVRQEKVNAIVIGLPVSLSGEESEQTEKTRQFVKKLQENMDNKIKIHTHPETYTSNQAKRNLMQEGKKNSIEEHAEAARLILENYIQSQHN